MFFQADFSGITLRGSPPGRGPDELDRCRTLPTDNRHYLALIECLKGGDWRSLKNIHKRRIRASPEDLGKWIIRLWSGAEDDCFPRDVIANWRKTDGVRDPNQLIPGRTRLGHGPFSFDFQQWDGSKWRVIFQRGGMKGWHGFDLVPEQGGTLLVHSIEADLKGAFRFAWPVLVAPVHDWAVEAIFDRIEEALATGSAPRHTTRPMAFAPRAAFFVLKRVARFI